ncbi:MAG TPA: hypothetical protein VFN38_11780, partial [Gemmatimonadaceae bacterium]|nr:hypothetical protein [Gemmatimonadaceae bacterium]
DSASIRTAARWLDSLKEEHPVELPAPRRIVREVPVERAQPAQREVPSITEDPFFIPGSPTPRRDTTVPRDTLRRPDTTTPPPA